MNNQFTTIAKELLEINEDLQFRVNNPSNSRIYDEAFELHIFPQTWGSTALGFGGIGGQAMTEAMTYVLLSRVDGEDCIVYFAGRFAYKVPYSPEFMDDLLRQCMEPVYKSGKYITAARNEVNNGTKRNKT